MFDVASGRGLYTTLHDGWTYLNSHQRALHPEKVTNALATAARLAGLAQPADPHHGVHGRPDTPGRTYGETYITAARDAVADFTNTSPAGVILGPGRTTLIRQLAAALSHTVTLGSTVVVARTASPALATPLATAAHYSGARLRWAEADLTTGALPAWQFSQLAAELTHLVALPAAHAHTGTLTDLAPIMATIRARSPQATTIVDITDLATYQRIDGAALGRMGADVLALDLAPLGGPDVGALIVPDPALLDRLRPPRPLPQTVRGRQVVEVDAPQAALWGGVPALVDHWASLDAAATGSRRRRLAATLPGVSAYLAWLGGILVERLQDLGRVQLLGVDPESPLEPASRLPRATFFIPGIPAADVAHRLATNGVLVGVVPPGADPLLSAMGLDEHGGAVTASLAPYNTVRDIDTMVRVIASLC